MTMSYESPKKIIGPGEIFGETSLIYNKPRDHSMLALENCEMWAIDKIIFKKVIEVMTMKQYGDNQSFLGFTSFLSNYHINNDYVLAIEPLSSYQKSVLAATLITYNYEKNHVIFTENEAAHSFYLIKEVIACCFFVIIANKGRG